MGKLLKEAFEKRIGHQDHETFINVVDAFFKEYRDDSMIIVPIQLIGGEYYPRVVILNNGKGALVIVSDEAYMSYFDDQSYYSMTPKGVVSLMKENENIDGILINPFSESHCFLPRNDTFAVLEMNGLEF